MCGKGPGAAQGRRPPHSVITTHRGTWPSGPAGLFTSSGSWLPVMLSQSRFWVIPPARAILLNVTSAVRELGRDKHGWSLTPTQSLPMSTSWFTLLFLRYTSHTTDDRPAMSLTTDPPRPRSRDAPAALLCNHAAHSCAVCTQTPWVSTPAQQFLGARPRQAHLACESLRSLTDSMRTVTAASGLWGLGGCW